MHAMLAIPSRLPRSFADPPSCQGWFSQRLSRELRLVGEHCFPGLYCDCLLLQDVLSVATVIFSPAWREVKRRTTFLQ